MSLILSHSQADIAYSAMRLLTEAGFDQFKARYPRSHGQFSHINKLPSGVVSVYVGHGAGDKALGDSEVHADQNAFASAYGLQQG